MSRTKTYLSAVTWADVPDGEKYGSSGDMWSRVWMAAVCWSKGAVLKSNRSPWIARPRAHPARTYDSGGDTTAEPGHPAAAPRANLIRQTAGSWFGGEHERGHPSASWWHAVCERHRLEEFGHGVTTERQSLVCVLILKKKCAWIDFLTISFQGRGYRWWQRGHVLCIFSGTLRVTFQRR